MADQVDRQGYVTISKDGTEAKIVPSSVPVWEKHGWAVVAQDEKPVEETAAPGENPTNTEEA